MASIWMHPPRDLTPQAVPEEEMITRQMFGWLHCDAPATVAEESQPETGASAEAALVATEPQTWQDDGGSIATVVTESEPNVSVGQQSSMGQRAKGGSGGERRGHKP